MKIGIVVRNYWSCGGIETYVKYLSEEITKSCKDNKVGIFYESDEKEDIYLKENLTLKSFSTKASNKRILNKTLKFLNVILSITNILIYIREFKKYLKDYDVIICRFSIHALCAKIAFPNKKIVFIPAVVTPKLLLKNIRAQKLKGKVRLLFHVFYGYFHEFIACRKVDKLIVFSQFIKNDLTKFYRLQRDIIINPPGSKFSNHNNNFIPECKKNILFVGRLVPEKNIELLIQAVELLEYPNISCTIVGGGILKEQLKLLAKKCNVDNKIDFVDATQDVEKYYRAADLFVLLSSYESFGQVIIEAMSFGIPVMAFKPSKKIQTASQELIQNKKNGYLIEKYSPEYIAKIIDNYYNDAKLKEQLQKNAFLSSKNFTWSKHWTLLKNNIN